MRISCYSALANGESTNSSPVSGLRKHGERSVPKWNLVNGSHGKAKLGVESWQGKDSKTYSGNFIKSYLEPEESAETDDEDIF